MVTITWAIRAVYGFEGVLLAWFTFAFVGRRMGRAGEAATGMALAVLYAIAKCYIERNVWLNMPGMVVIAAAYLLLRRAPLSNSLWLACVFSASVELGRVLVYGTTSVLGIPGLYQHHQWTLRIVANGLKLLGIWLCRRSFQRYKHVRIHALDCAMILLPFAYIYFMRIGFLRDSVVISDEQFKLYAFFFMCGATLLSIWTVFFHVSSEENRREAERLQQVMQEAYVLTRKKAEVDAEIMRMYHDIKHQLTAVLSAETGEDQRRYAERLLESARQYETIQYTGNAMLDSLLNRKRNAAQERGVQLNLMMQEMDYGFMDDLDVCALFGNALDNAIEATEQNKAPENRCINVKSVTVRGIWVLKVENAFEREPIRCGQEFVTSKTDGNMHGIGLQSIRYCAQKYGGRMEASAQEHVFTLRVTVPTCVGETS